MLAELIARPCDLLKARSSFRRQEAVNWTVTIVFFVLVFFILMLLLWPVIAFVVSTATAFALFFFVLDKRAIKIVCNHDSCKKTIMTNTPWVCGFCKAANKNVDDFPFIHRCQHCGAEPKAYKCHHCGELIFLADDQLKANHAFCLGTEVKEVPPPPEPDEIALQKREVQDLRHQIVLTRLNAELKKQKRIEESLKKKNPEEEAEESLAKHVAKDIAVFSAARRVRLKYTEEFKDDSDLVEKINLSVDQFLEEH